MKLAGTRLWKPSLDVLPNSLDLKMVKKSMKAVREQNQSWTHSVSGFPTHSRRTWHEGSREKGRKEPTWPRFHRYCTRNEGTAGLPILYCPVLSLEHSKWGKMFQQQVRDGRVITYRKEEFLWTTCLRVITRNYSFFKDYYMSKINKYIKTSDRMLNFRYVCFTTIKNNLKYI